MAQKYVDRSEVLKKVGYTLRYWGMVDCIKKSITDRIKAIPIADVEPVKHGHWTANGIAHVCSLCGRSFVIEQGDADMNYCPHCGARMDGEAEDG